MIQHRILFLAANPTRSSGVALDLECAAIESELRMTSHRDDFEFRSKWAVTVDDMMRHLVELQPTIIHFSGHGADPAGSPVNPTGKSGIFLLDENGGPQLVTPRALTLMIKSTADSARVLLLNACYSEPQADALRSVVDCVVGMAGAVDDGAARSFAVGFYRALGNRRSVGNAFDQAVATLAGKGMADENLPRCLTRRGVDAYRVILDAFVTPPVSGSDSAGVGPRASVHTPSPVVIASASSSRRAVDVGILTIRVDEFRAVLGEFPGEIGRHRGPRREYALRRADAGGGEDYTVAVIRQAEQGNGEAQDAARDLIEDLAPRLLIVVGIAGGLPSDDLTLGDVVIATRIHDFTVEARKAQEPTEYAASGGPITRELAALAANLAAREAELGDWTAGLPEPPRVRWTKKQLYGPAGWQDKLRSALQRHHGKGKPPRRPRYIDGVIASSDRLVKDPELLFPWIATARNILAVEMESAGVYRAARERCPMLAIRGISDIVGLKRAEAWTAYACRSAAAFTRAFLRTRPVPLGHRERSFDAPPPADPAPPREPPPGDNRVLPVTGRRSPAASEPSAGATAPTATAPDEGARSTEADERLAGMKRDVAAVLKAHPRLIPPLADRIGCRRVPEEIADRLFGKASEVVALLLDVWDAQSSLPDGHTDCQAAHAILCIVLPYVPDWRDKVDEVRTGKEEIVLPFSSATIAEAVMAGGAGRHCSFEQKAGAEPYGKWALELPSDAQTATFTSADHVRDSLVEMLDSQLRVGGRSPAARLVKVRGALQRRRNLKGQNHEQRYLLFRDAEHPEFLYALVRTALQPKTALQAETGLPGLILVRLRGSGEDDDEAGIEDSVRLMLQSRTPR